MKNNNFTKNFIWNMIGSVFNAFNSLFLLILITRINGLESAGIFSIAFATASILYVLAIYSGRNCHLTDITGKITDKEYIISRLINCIITIFILLIYVLLKGYDSLKTYILILLCMWKILEAFSDVLYAILQKKEELYKAGISLFLKSIIGISAFGIVDTLTKNLNFAFTILYMINIIIFIIYDIPNVLKVIGRKEKIEFEHIKNIFKNEFWIFSNTALIMYMLNEPKYVIEKFFTSDIQAIFNIILMPASIIPLFSQFLMAPFISSITKAYKEKRMNDIKKIDKKISIYILVFGTIAVIIGYLIGIPILELIYNQNLSEYKLNLVILLAAYILYAEAYVKTIILTAFRKLKEQFIVHIISTIIIIIMSIMLIKSFAITGAVITYVILMVFYYLMLYGIERYNLRKEEKKVKKL